MTLLTDQQASECLLQAQEESTPLGRVDGRPQTSIVSI